MKITKDEVVATQDQCIFQALVDLCGTTLTSAQIETVKAKLNAEMRQGNMAWAFDPSKLKDIE